MDLVSQIRVGRRINAYAAARGTSCLVAALWIGGALLIALGISIRELDEWPARLNEAKIAHARELDAKLENAIAKNKLEVDRIRAEAGNLRREFQAELDRQRLADEKDIASWKTKRIAEFDAEKGRLQRILDQKVDEYNTALKQLVDYRIRLETELATVRAKAAEEIAAARQKTLDLLFTLRVDAELWMKLIDGYRRELTQSLRRIDHDLELLERQQAEHPAARENYAAVVALRGKIAAFLSESDIRERIPQPDFSARLPVISLTEAFSRTPNLEFASQSSELKSARELDLGMPEIEIKGLKIPELPSALGQPKPLSPIATIIDVVEARAYWKIPLAAGVLMWMLAALCSYDLLKKRPVSAAPSDTASAPLPSPQPQSQIAP